MVKEGNPNLDSGTGMIRGPEPAYVYTSSRLRLLQDNAGKTTLLYRLKVWLLSFAVFARVGPLADPRGV